MKSSILNRYVPHPLYRKAASSLPKELPILLNLSIPAIPSTLMVDKLSPMDTSSLQYAINSTKGMAVAVFGIPKFDKNGLPDIPKLSTIGALVEFKEFSKEKSDIPVAIYHVVRRAAVEDVHVVNNNFLAKVTYPELVMPPKEDSKANKDLSVRAFCIIDEIRRLADASNEKMHNPGYTAFFNNLETLPIAELLDYGSTFLENNPPFLQQLIAELNLGKRAEMLLYNLKVSQFTENLKHQVISRLNARLEKNQRAFYLNEQIREIKNELGDDYDSAEEDIDIFKKRLEKLGNALNEEAKKRITDEIRKLRSLQKNSPDYSIAKNYLDWLTEMPWNTTTEDNLDVANARMVLNRDHYGLDDVKNRILEFISVAKLKGSIDGSIICLIGPPGVGKTSLGHSIAEALNRKFFRFSLGGMKDESEIKGHRRTYIGAQPGKLVSALKTCESKNPVIMLDEIDKLGNSMQGDPAAALLEVLDPEQNSAFRDHFLDVPFDLSQVLFIATANVKDTIPEPLLDRMEIIQLPGYITEEKINIAEKHLIPKQLPRHGLTERNIKFPKNTLRQMILDYARDSGVRSLENAIKGCMRKVAVKIAENKISSQDTVTISVKELTNYLGKQRFYDDSLVKSPLPGVAMGLAWTSVGGATLYIEVLSTPAEPSLKITGQLGDVMKESTQIACSLVEKQATAFGIDAKFFKKNKLHIHVPAGATPKDGPSAGITIASAIISCATGKALPAGWAMTGELTLTSRVLPVGGIKEKMIAAQRSGVKNVILPKENEKDFDEIIPNARKGLTAHFVSTYDEVYRLLWG